MMSLRILGGAASAWSRHGASSMGAAIAFYALISLPPAVAVVLELASLALGPTAARQGLLSQVHLLWGSDAAATTIAIAHYALRIQAQTWGTWVAVVTCMITASTVFVEMRDSLNVIWGQANGGAVSRLVKDRLIAFGVLIVLGLAVSASVVSSTLLEAADRHYLNRLGLSAIMIGMIGNGVAGIVILVLLAALYKLLPEHHVAWIDAWSGAGVVTCLYLVGKEIIAFYLGSPTVVAAFGGGVAGALIVLLLWFYYSAQIFLYGAELSHELSLDRNSRGSAHRQDPMD